MSFDGANIQQFPDILTVSVEILALRGWEGEKKRAVPSAVAEAPPSCLSVASRGVTPPLVCGYRSCALH